MPRRKKSQKDEDDFEIITNIALLRKSGREFELIVERILRGKIVCVKHPVIELIEKLERENQKEGGKI